MAAYSGQLHMLKFGLVVAFHGLTNGRLSIDQLKKSTYQCVKKEIKSLWDSGQTCIIPNSTAPATPKFPAVFSERSQVAWLLQKCPVSFSTLHRKRARSGSLMQLFPSSLSMG
ncbi:hypothetical protein CEXT_140541 [Caerostris extrusa]|uniref:Uncharacterized protein n=1 Tax=Caerostris extrusa TaxID=172846 RepID=A0AAV4YC08_CAEEX|nr:hypothetical protein CEXT_140541 [Caerostris extrusa]